MSTTRRQQAFETRISCAETARNRVYPNHVNNGEELRYRRITKCKNKAPDCEKPKPCKNNDEPSYIASYTKGLPHDPETGLLLNPPDFHQFVLGIQSGDTSDFAKTPLGPGLPPPRPGGLSKQRITPEITNRKPIWQSQIAQGTNSSDNTCGADLRAWESAAAGLTFELEGPDPQSVTMPPAPRIDSAELAAEMAEDYLMALMRDVHFSQLRSRVLGTQHDRPEVPGCKCECPKPKAPNPDEAAEILHKVKVHVPDQYACHDRRPPDPCKMGKNWFELECCDLNDVERARHRDKLDRQHLFRGIAPGDNIGPYLSQFLLIGNDSRGGGGVLSPADGQISYGAIRIDQRVRVATPCKDYMTTFEAWVDVQNAASVRDNQTYCSAQKGECREFPAYRFMTTPRDLATYVHFDALYEAYLNACLILMDMGAPFDPGVPFGAPDVVDHQQGFAHFGGPHILSLVTEVATRALKAVRYQKFNIHRRPRPEALGGLIDSYKSGNNPNGELDPVKPLVDALDCAGILKLVSEHNTCQNKTYPDRKNDASGRRLRHLLPMAFPEGSPMHPAYGAGHATVAGACVTILKAFFDHGWQLRKADCTPLCYEPNADGSQLVDLGGKLCQPLTVEGELNKLAANIAIGRDWAGVHYFTDYIESLRMGEQIALGILEEQRLTFNENFTMTIPLFDGTTIKI